MSDKKWLEQPLIIHETQARPLNIRTRTVKRHSGRYPSLKAWLEDGLKVPDKDSKAEEVLVTEPQLGQKAGEKYDPSTDPANAPNTVIVREAADGSITTIIKGKDK